jgi:putative endonuclease
MDRAGIGKDAEEYALRYLNRQGLQLITRNYLTRHGEIDLIMEDSGTLVFIEVRFRRNKRFGGAGVSVTPDKQRKLLATAEHYLQRHAPNQPVRVDVLAIEGETPYWIKNAFEA